MATIDPNIAMGYKPVQIENPLNQLAAMTQIQAGQQGQQLNALQMRKAQQDFDTQNALAEAYKGAFNTETGALDYNLLTRRLAEGGAGSAIPTVLKTRKEAEQAEATLGKTKVETREAKQKLLGTMSRDLSRSPTDSNLNAHFEDLVSSGLFSPQEITIAQAKRDQLLAMPLADRIPILASQGATAGDLKPVIKETDIGGNVLSRVLDAYSGAQISQGTPIKKTPTPGELLVDARAREAVARGENPNIVANTTTDAAGNVTQFNKFGKVVGKVNAAGKPSATFEKAANVKAELQKNLGTTITELKDAIKPGGLLEESTASGAGKVLDAAGNFVGYATKGSIAAASLAPIADMALKMVPRFEGPQSDKDTASYKQAAGELANSTLPVATRKAAAKTIIRIMENRKNQFTTEGMINEGISSGGPALPPGFTVDK